jgi:hypothetical protein
MICQRRVVVECHTPYQEVIREQNRWQTGRSLELVN